MATPLFIHGPTGCGSGICHHCGERLPDRVGDRVASHVDGQMRRVYHATSECLAAATENAELAEFPPHRPGVHGIMASDVTGYHERAGRLIEEVV